DTEVLLAAIERWGFEATLERARGMFAFALWDAGARVLRLARDRVGKKPLYYGGSAGRWYFASELKALRAVPGFAPALDPLALRLYLRHGNVPSPHSIF